MRYSAVIVDDEPLARQRVQAMLAPFDEIEVTGSYGDPLKALAALETQPPNVLFLDVQMPRLDGFALLEALPRDKRPSAVIFVTAHDRYALQAFDSNAIDYLLKPFTKSRFAEALSRTLERLASAPRGSSASESLLRTLRKEQRTQDRFPVWDGNALHLVRAADIRWCEADRNYVRIHAGNTTYLLRSTLHNLERRLDPERFIRIHRSSIINIEQLTHLEPWFHGEYVAFLADGTKVRVSRTYSDRLRRLFDVGDAS
jgi:two-component system LytT family response regulator